MVLGSGCPQGDRHVLDLLLQLALSLLQVLSDCADLSLAKAFGAWWSFVELDLAQHFFSLSLGFELSVLDVLWNLACLVHPG